MRRRVRSDVELNEHLGELKHFLESLRLMTHDASHGPILIRYTGLIKRAPTDESPEGSEVRDLFTRDDVMRAVFSRGRAGGSSSNR